MPLEHILALPAYDFHRVEKLIEEIKVMVTSDNTPTHGAIQLDQSQPYNMASEVIRDERPFHPQRLWQTCNKFLGKKIYRSKGFFWLASRDKESLLWNQAAGSISLELIGSWRAGVLDDPDNILDHFERNTLRKMVDATGGRFGDRHCHLTVIGDQDQVGIFTQALKNMLPGLRRRYTSKAGGVFEDRLANRTTGNMMRGALGALAPTATDVRAPTASRTEACMRLFYDYDFGKLWPQSALIQMANTLP